MAQVLEAMAQGMDGFERRVAIKRLLPQHARNDERRRMFLEEARIGSRLHHGSIVPIFDYGLIDGTEFLAMEFVDGLDALRAVSGSTAVDAMPEGIALHVIAEVAHALAYIHELNDEQGRSLGIVHRDVSPPNILLSWDGDVKLSDFGIALSDWRDEHTAAGVVKGKMHYMAPEQALGERVGAPADVYALGATLDALLGGQAPGPITTDEEAWTRMQQARARGVSAATAELIRDCQAREPSRRPSASVVAARAGALASRRLGRDGRGSLRSWLQPLRPHTMRASALDDLMGLCLVPVGPDGARTFTVTQVWQAAHGPRQGIAHSTAQGTAVETRIEHPLARRSYRGRVIGGAALALAIAAAGVLVSPMGPLRRPAPPTTPTLAAAAASPPRAQPVPPKAPLSPPGPLASAAPPSPVQHAAHPRHHVQASHPHEMQTSPASRAALARGGWLRVGGAKLAGGRVTVDGSSVGFAPLELALPLGSHTVSVNEPASGSVMVHTAVEIDDHHTRVDPLRILR
jgi:serine/threonine-protein kinase